MKHLHPADHQLFEEVAQSLKTYADFYRLPLKKVKPMPRRLTYSRHGDCSKKGKIRITVRDFHKGTWALKPELPYVIVQTIAHELAHLKYWKHQTEWFELYSRILNRMALDGELDRYRQLV